MSNHEKERFERLVRRLNWLRVRIYKAEKENKDLNYDKAEASALEWGIDIIEKYFEEKNARSRSVQTVTNGESVQ